MKHSRTHAHAPAPAQTKHNNDMKPVKKLSVLIACEESQAECMAFRKLGHNAYSCDIQPCRPKIGHPEWHIQGDVIPLLNGLPNFVTQDGTPHAIHRWDLIVAHPPCTYLCKVGSIHLVRKIPSKQFNGCPYGWYVESEDEHFVTIINAARLKQQRKAIKFFLQCWNTKAAHYLAVENPIPMARAKLPQPSTYIDPSWFGVKYTKKTLFWLRNLPPILPIIEHPNPKCFVTASRGKYRSRTFPQVAEAIAQQWSQFILDDMFG